MRIRRLFRYTAAMVLMLCGASAGFTSCSDDGEPPAPASTGYTMTLEAVKAHFDTRALAPGTDNKVLHATWKQGDIVEVWTADKKLGVMTAEKDGATTTLKATLETPPQVGDVLTLKYLSPDYYQQAVVKFTLKSAHS